MAKLDLSNNNNWARQSPGFIRPIASMLKTNRSLKEINLAENNLNAEAGRIFSEGLHDNGALASLNIANNHLTRGKWTNALRDGDEDDPANYKSDMSGVIALAEAITQ